VAKDSDRWRALLNAVRTLGFRKMRGISGFGEDLLASQKGFCSVELVCPAVDVFLTFAQH
jgi:hypothetical protein